MGSRSWKSAFSPNNDKFCVSLAKIHPFIKETECRQEATPTPTGSPLKTICPHYGGGHKKGHNLAKISRMITNIKLNLYFTIIYILLQTSNEINASLQNRAESNINTTTKTKSEKGHNSAKILQMITNTKLDLSFLFNDISFCKLTILM